MEMPMSGARSKSFTVEPAIWKYYPGMKLICMAATGLDNKIHRPAVAEYFDSTQTACFEITRSIALDDYPPISEWRRIQPGPTYPAAHESLGARVAAGRMLKRISPLVDWYNACSIEMFAREIAAPIGAWCSDTLPILRLGITRGGESFTALDKTTIERVEAGETAYFGTRQSELVTRHFVWKQAKRGAIRPDTKSFFLVSELIQPFAMHVDTVLNELVETCERLFSVKMQSTVLNTGDAGWNWMEES
jgi:DNA/RNA-binding domain of Phe-tRNA-synthetase-like protein